MFWEQSGVEATMEQAAFGPDVPCGSDPLHSSPLPHTHLQTHTFDRREPKLALDLALWVAEARRQES